MKLYSRIVHSVSHAMNWLAVFIIAAMMVLTCADVVLRYFGLPIRGAYDISRVLGSAIFALPIASSYSKGFQVAVDSLFGRGILRIITDTIACLASVFITALITWRSALLAQDVYLTGRTTDTVPIPLWPFIYVMMFGVALYCLILLADLPKAFRRSSTQ